MHKKNDRTENQEFSPNFIESAEVLLLSPYIGGDTVKQHGWNAFLFDVDLFYGDFCC